MKNCISIILTTALAILLTCSLAQAVFDIPEHVYTMSQLKKAQEKAKTDEKPLTFIGSNKETTCPLTTAASENIFQGLKDYSIIVYVEESDLNALPAIISTALDSSASGKYLPKTVIVNQSMDTVIHMLPYPNKEQGEKNIKEAQKIISGS